MYSLKEAKNAVQDWIDELGTMDWPADWGRVAHPCAF
jgi:hypothetical protein